MPSLSGPLLCSFIFFLSCKFRELCCKELEVEYFTEICFDIPPHHPPHNQEIKHDFYQKNDMKGRFPLLQFCFVFSEVRGAEMCLIVCYISCVYMFIPHVICDQLKREYLEKREENEHKLKVRCLHLNFKRTQKAKCFQKRASSWSNLPGMASQFVV